MLFVTFAHRFACRRALHGAVFCLLALLLSATIRADELPTKPILRIETGMHTAAIRQIGMDAEQKYLVTASEDKTVRVWERATGRLLQTLRPPLGDGNEGKLGAVALSPNGQTVACAGETGYAWDGTLCIYCFDRASGLLTHCIAGLPQVIFSLTYSPDGNYLAATLGGPNGLRVFRTRDYRQVAEDKDYGDSSYDVDFDRRGRLVTTCLDGYVRLYDADFMLWRKVKAPDGTHPFPICFAPDGKRVVVGYGDSAKVSMLSGDDLKPLFAPDVADVTDGLASVCWAADGSRLYAAGRYGKDGIEQIRVWQDGGKGVATDWPAAQNTIYDLLALREGGVAFASGGPTLGLLDSRGKQLWKRATPTADYRVCLEHFLLARE